MIDDLLPGEAGPLPLRVRGLPISEREALGVARRHARLLGERGRHGRGTEPPESFPVDAPPVMASYKIPPRVLAYARARCEMEGVSVTDLVLAALIAYGEGNPATPTVIDPARPDTR